MSLYVSWKMIFSKGIAFWKRITYSPDINQIIFFKKLYKFWNWLLFQSWITRKPIITPQEFVVPFSLSCFYRSYMPALTYSNFKNYDVKTWWQKIAIYKLPNNSRSKDNQTMKFGQLIKYNTRNIFLEKSQNVVETTYFYLV